MNFFRKKEKKENAKRDSQKNAKWVSALDMEKIKMAFLGTVFRKNTLQNGFLGEKGEKNEKISNPEEKFIFGNVLGKEGEVEDD